MTTISGFLTSSNLLKMKQNQQVQGNQQNAQQQNGANKANFEAELKKAGIPDEVIKDGKNAVQEYAKTNNIQLPPDPETQNAGQNQNAGGQGQSIFGSGNVDNTALVNQANNDFEKELKNLGIPDNVIKEGKSSIEDYAKKNQITLPDANQQVGMKLNVQV